MCTYFIVLNIICFDFSFWYLSRYSTALSKVVASCFSVFIYAGDILSKANHYETSLDNKRE